MTNIAALKNVFTEVRENLASRGEDESIYSFYRWFVQDAKAAGKLGKPASDPVADLRASLNSASRAAYLDGATDKQINLIVKLAVEHDDYNILSGGRLTKGEASRIIDHMIGR